VGEARAESADIAKESGPGVDDARKALRKKMFDAMKRKRWEDAAAAGIELKNGFELDWEAALGLAESLQKAKRYDDAITAYEAFLEAFPDNKAVWDARYQLAGLLIGKKRYNDARPVLEAVSAGATSKKLRGLAEQALKEITAR
jgi:TolA-binding protein